MPDDPKLPLSTLLKNYQEACKEEFEVEPDDVSNDQIKGRTQSLLIQGIPKAAAGMLLLAEHAESEQVRLSAQKYLLDNGLGKIGKLSGQDRMQDLIDKLLSDETPTHDGK